ALYPVFSRATRPGQNWGGLRFRAPGADPLGTMEAPELLRLLVEKGASDLHLKVGSPPFYRVDGELSPADLPPLRARDTESIAAALLPMRKSDGFAETAEADCGDSLPGVGRFRIKVFRRRGVVAPHIR